MTLVLETLGSNQALDLGGLGVRLLALLLGLDLSSNDVLADLYSGKNQSISHLLGVLTTRYSSQALLGGIHCKGFFSLIPQKQRPSRR